MNFAWGLNNSETSMTFFDNSGSSEFLTNAKIILHPNPATTELNIEFGDGSYKDAIFTINDMSGRRYVAVPVNGKEQLTIPLDRRFVPGDYSVTLISGRNKISKAFKVVE